MRLLGDNIYIESSEAVKAGVTSHKYLTVAKSRNSSTFSFIKDPTDNRKVLIEYSSLKDCYKKLIIAKYGEPTVYLCNQIIKPLLQDNPEDTACLNNYRLPNGNALTDESLQEYKAACRWLYFLSGINLKKIKTIGYGKATDFYKAVITMLKADGVRLPYTYNKLREKVTAYKEYGAHCVVHNGSGKSGNNRKIVDSFCESLLIELIAHHNQFEDPFVAQKYNEQAAARGYKRISASTVGAYRRERDMLISASREGTAAYRNKYDKIIHRTGPTAPLMLINSDDNDFDLYMQEVVFNEKGHRGVNYNFRFKLMVVMDSFKSYPLGYAIGTGQTEELVRAAFADAINHIYELTGGYYLWQQIVTDHWGISALEEWYSSQATFTPATVGNARSKMIEAAFGRWHRILKQYPNYAGHNITAKNKPNFEAIKQNKKLFPEKQDGHHQVHHIINRIRTDINANGKSIQQEWLEAFHANIDRMLPLDTKRRLQLFGTRHWETENRDWQNELTNGGITITVSGKRYTYDVPEVDYMRHVGKKFRITYDPYNMSEILATADEGRVQLICPLYEKAKMAIADMTAGDRALVNVRLAEKKRINQYVLDDKEKRREILSQHGITAEGVLQAGYQNKEISQAADNAYRQRLLNDSKDAFDYDSNDTSTQQPPTEKTDLWDL